MLNLLVVVGKSNDDMTYDDHLFGSNAIHTERSPRKTCSHTSEGTNRSKVTRRNLGTLVAIAGIFFANLEGKLNDKILL